MDKPPQILEMNLNPDTQFADLWIQRCGEEHNIKLLEWEISMEKRKFQGIFLAFFGGIWAISALVPFIRFAGGTELPTLLGCCTEVASPTPFEWTWLLIIVRAFMQTPLPFIDEIVFFAGIIIILVGIFRGKKPLLTAGFFIMVGFAVLEIAWFLPSVNFAPMSVVNFGLASVGLGPYLLAGVSACAAILSLVVNVNWVNKSHFGAQSTGPKVSNQPIAGDSTYRKMLAQVHELETKEKFADASQLYQEIIDYCEGKGLTQAKELAEKAKRFTDMQK